MAALRAGVAAIDITPAVGIQMGGYWGRRSPATGVNDPLQVRAVVWSDAASRAALVVLDLVALHAEQISRLRRRIREAAGIAAESTLICCTHTHSGPLTYPYRGMGAVDYEYMALVEERTVACVQRAGDQLEAATLAYARRSFQLGVNRRGRAQGEKEAAVVSHIHLVRIDGTDGPIASVFSHPCHPVVLGANNAEISADFPGAAVRYLERASGVPAIFVNGACGDVNPRTIRGTFDDVERLGVMLGQAAEQSLAEAEPLSGGRLASVSRKVSLPLLPAPGRLRCRTAHEVARLKVIYKRCRSGGRSVSTVLAAAGIQEWAREVLQWRRDGAQPRWRDLEITGVRLGDLVFLGFEGELFARYQLELEQSSPFRPTIVCGYANGCVGYLPTADEYPRGGYEIDQAYKVYGEVQMFAPVVEQLIRSNVQEVLKVLTRSQ